MKVELNNRGKLYNRDNKCCRRFLETERETDLGGIAPSYNFSRNTDKTHFNIYFSNNETSCGSRHQFNLFISLTLKGFGKAVTPKVASSVG